MFVRLGITEIGENAIAHIFCDEAAVTLNQFSAAAMIGADHVPQVLRVEPSRTPIHVRNVPIPEVAGIEDFRQKM